MTKNSSRPPGSVTKNISRTGLAMRLWSILPIMLGVLLLLSAIGTSHADSVVKVGVYDFAPLVFVDKEGKPGGLFIDVLEYVAQQQGWRIEYVRGTWDQCLRRIEKGEIDLITSIGYSKDRATRIDFTREFLFLDWGRVYERSETDLESVFDMEGKRVAVLKGSVYTEGFRSLLKQFDVRAELVEKDDYRQVFKAIGDGEVDAGVNGRVAGILLGQEYSVSPTEILFSPIKIGFATPKGKGAEILRALDSQIAELKGDKNSFYYDRLRHRTEFYSKRSTVSPWLLRGLSLAAVLSLSSLIFVYLLRKQVRIRTSELVLANEALLKSEEKLRLAAETIEDVFWMTTPELEEMIYVSPAYERIWGRSLDSLYESPKSFVESVHPGDSEQLIKIIEEHRETPWECDYRIVRPDGAIRWIHDRGYPILDENGNLRLRTGISADITDRKRTEEALRESEERFRLAMEATKDGVWDWDLKTDIVLRSPGFFSMLGYREEEFCGRFGEWQDLVHPEDLKSVLNALNEYLNGKREVYEVEFRMFTKSGDLAWILSRGEVVVCDEGGKPLRMVGTHTDITERKKAEDAVRESESFLNNVVDQSPYPMWISDHEGTLIRMNKALGDLLHISDQDVVGIYNVLLDNIVEAQGFLPQVKSVFEEGATARFQLKYDSSQLEQIQLSRPTSVILEVTMFPIRDSSGKITNAVIQHMDVTERRRIEEALQASEQRYRGVFENAAIGIDIVDAEGRFLKVNASLSQMLGYSEDELLNLTIFDVSHPDDVEVSRINHEKMVRGETDSYRFEKRYLGKDGEVMWADVSVSVVRVPDGDYVATAGVIADITERKRAAELLQQAESRYRSLFEHAPSMYVVTRNDHGVPVINDCNRLFLSTLGYSREEVVGRHLSRFYSQASTNELLEGGGYTRALAGEFFIGERQLRKRDGTFLPTLLYTAPEKNPNGEVIGTCAMFVDITEQKRAEAALLRSEAQLSNALTIAHLGHWEYDATKDLFTFNDHFYRIFRTTAEQVGGYTVSSAEYAQRFVYPEDRSVVASEIRKALETNDPNFSGKLEHRIVYADGEIGFITVRYFLLKDDLGRTVGTYGVNQDITDRKKAEEALRSEREQLLSIFESINEVILVIDPGSYEILYANRFTEDLYGKKLIGANCFEELNGLGSPCGHCSIDRVMEFQGKPHQWEYRNSVLNKDFLATDRMIRWADGREVKFQIAVDVTERRLAEEEKEKLRSQLLQAQKMEAVGTLAGGIAHDFNNLLQVTLGYSELLLSEKSSEDPDYADLQRIHQAARSGSELVRNLLTFSRKTERTPLPMNLNKVIRHVRKLLHRAIPKMIDIRLDLSEDVARISADASQIEQVIMNLAVNARDAMGEEGLLTLRTENVTLDEEYCRLNVEATPGKHVLLSVSDTGQGMDRETLQHIFEPFYTTKELGRGTGLGLAMVYGIVKQHDGHVTCYSEIGKGTTFRIYLPAILSVSEDAIETVTEMPALGTETLLLVDDEDSLRILGERILTKNGYAVLSAANGEEALTLYTDKKEQISLVILDLMMPTMGGKDCLQELLKIDPAAKVLIASGYSADTSTTECIELGAKGFVGKPFRMKELLQQIREVLDET